MFDNLKNLGSMLANARQMQDKVGELQERLAKKVVEAESGAGAVKVRINGKMDVLDLTIDPAMVGTLAGEGSEADKEMIEELITSAMNAAIAKARNMLHEEVREMTGGMNIPGLEDMLGA